MDKDEIKPSHGAEKSLKCTAKLLLRKKFTEITQEMNNFGIYIVFVNYNLNNTPTENLGTSIRANRVN